MTTKENIIPYFRIKPDNRSNRAIIKYVGSINDNEKVVDEQMDIVDETKTIHIVNDTSYNITGRIYKSNIVGSHIVYSHRYPVVYLDISYDKTIVSGSLFQIFYSIQINHEEKKKIKQLKNYVGLNFSGNWVRHLDCDQEFKDNYETFLREEGKKIYHEHHNFYLETECDKWVNSFVTTEKTYFESFFGDQDVEFISINNIRDKFVEECTTDRFKRFIKIALKCRELQRRSNYGVMNEYIVPSKVTNMSDITNQLIDDDEIVYDD